MSFSSQTYSQIYRNFRTIHTGEYRRIVRFYERHEKEIVQLPFEEYFDLLICYTQALFEVEEYRKCLKMADIVIQTSILENITILKEKDVYQEALFRKAACLHRLGQLDNAQYVLEELIKINPQEHIAIHYLHQVMRDNKPAYTKTVHALSVLLFLISALVICVEVLVIKNLYKNYDTIFEWTRNGLFGAGILLLVVCELLHRWRVERYANRFVEKARKVKFLKQYQK
jgi:tetratricopeptide (TPR) repeat protein